MSKITKSEVCQGCLSSERRLSPLGAHTKLLQRILGNDLRLARSAVNNFLNPHQQLCWECHQMLLNVHKFRQRVLQAQTTLNSFRRYEKEKAYALPLSSLKVMMKNGIDCIVTYTDESDCPILNCMQENDEVKNNIEIKTEIKLECPDCDCSENNAICKEVNYAHDEIANDAVIFNEIEDFQDEITNKDNSEPLQKVKKDVKRDSEEDDEYEPTKFIKGDVENKLKEKTVALNAKYRQVECDIEKIRTQFKRFPLDINDLYVFLEKYRNSREYKEAQYKCDKCVHDFLNEDLLKCHLNKHDKAESTPYKCDVCETYWSTQDLLDMHYRNQHMFKLECLLCGEQFLRKRLLITHQNVMHNLTVECLECGCKFDDRKSFWRHHRELHSTFSCDHCDSSYRTKASIIRHFRDHHRLFKCDECSKQYKIRKTLLFHKKYIHTLNDSELTYCVECDKRFPNELQMKHHMKYSSKHGGAARVFKCDECGKQYKIRKTFLFHKKYFHTRNDSEHTYCVECDKRFPNELQMKFHLKYSSKHGGTTRFSCPECDKKFPHKCLQEKHYKLVHLKQYEQHPCPICAKCFATKESLIRHKRRVHDKLPKVKNKFCQHCDKAFADNAVLVNHIRTHTGERPFVCEFCPSSFTQRAPMIAHTRTIHNKTDYMRPAAAETK